MKALYSLSHLDDWLDVAVDLQKQQNWQPVYWITSAEMAAKIHKIFPETVCHNNLDIIYGRSPKGHDLFAPRAVDQKLLEDLGPYSDTVLKMMDRITAVDDFTYEERKRYFFRLLVFALNVLDRFQPDVFLMSYIPHHPPAYALYLVCQARGVPTIFFRVLDSYEQKNLVIKSLLEDPIGDDKPGNFPVNADKIQAMVDAGRKDYDKGKPKYMTAAIKQSAIQTTTRRAIFNILRKINLIRFFTAHRITAYLKLKGRHVEDSKPTHLDLYWFKLTGYFRKLKLKRIYYKHCIKNPDMEKPFIYLPLHYQPESSTSPEGGVFVDQYLVVNMVSACIPKGWRILVKEHPGQFMPNMEGEQGRKRVFYEDLAAMENVRMVPLNTSPFDLIDKSMAVATITGMTGLEAVIREKPVLVFGVGCWYRSMEGVFFVPTEDRLKKAISIIKKSVQINRERVVDFLKKTDSHTFHGALIPDPNNLVPRDQNVKNIVKAVTLKWQSVSTNPNNS